MVARKRRFGKTSDRIRCVLFDLDGTLYNSQQYSQKLDNEITKYVAEAMSSDYAHAKLLLEQRRKNLGTLTRSLKSLGIDRHRFFVVMADRMKPSEYLSADPRVPSALAKLRLYGFRVGLVSNSGRPLVEKILEALQMDSSNFDVTVTSSEVEPKPSPEPFLAALKLLKCRRESAIYVGDRDEAELRPAKRLGIRTILLDPSGKSSTRWADFVVSDISEIPTTAKSMFGR
jgi:putative hydrolase of the HAD superfamily